MTTEAPREFWDLLHEWHESSNPERIEWIEHRFGELFAIAAASLRSADPWRMAVDDAMVCAGLDCTTPQSDAFACVKQLVSVTREIALDPAVSAEAQALIDRGSAQAPQPDPIRAALVEMVDAQQEMFFLGIGHPKRKVAQQRYNDAWEAARAALSAAPALPGQPEVPSYPTQLSGEARTTDALKQALDALAAADQFITNGIALGYIRMPDADCPDSAHKTPPMVRAAVASIRAALAGNGATERTGQDEQVSVSPLIGEEDRVTKDAARYQHLKAEAAWYHAGYNGRKQAWYEIEIQSDTPDLDSAIDSAMAADASTGGRGEKK